MSEQYMWLAARSLDLCVLGLFFWFVYTRYALPIIEQQMSQEVQEKQDALDQIVDLKQQVELLDQQISYDQEDTDRLKKEVLLWQTTIKERAEQRQKKYVERQKRLQELYKERMDALAADRLYHKVVPEALMDAQQELQRTFANEKDGRQYVQDVLALMKKEAS